MVCYHHPTRTQHTSDHRNSNIYVLSLITSICSNVIFL